VLKDRGGAALDLRVVHVFASNASGLPGRYRWDEAMTHLVKVDRLTKRFGELKAVDGISFSVDGGEVLGFLGPNGSGKSTTMRMITGFLPVTSGRAMVCGFDVAESPVEVKKRLGYLPEGAPLYEDMTASGLLSFVAEVRGYSRRFNQEAVERSIALFKLEGVRHQSVGTLSKGFKRRVALANAFLHEPEVLILDEPTDGLDPNQKHEVRELIRHMARDQNRAIIISTHILEEVDAVCTRAVIIARGRILVDGTPAELEARSPLYNAVSIRIDGRQESATRAALGAIPEIASVETVERGEGWGLLRLIPKDRKSIAGAIGARMKAGDFTVEEMHVERGHLDEVFREITKQAEAAVPQALSPHQ
jgi:ABC-2 type transport system ATP-binding protein